MFLRARERTNIMLISVTRLPKDVAQNPVKTNYYGPKALVTSRKNIKNPKMTL
jgi:hypothetical protein